MHFDKEVDARRLLCPLPIFKAKKVFITLKPGEVLRIMTTDPASVKDFESFARMTKSDLLATIESGTGKSRQFEFYIRRTKDSVLFRVREPAPAPAAPEKSK